MTANDGMVTNYTYDANNRLTKTIETLGSTVKTSTYTYDKNGNTLKKWTEVKAPVGGNPSGSLSETSPYVELYEYDLLNRMTYSNAENGEAMYKYRPDGLRFSKNDTVHIWDGANIVGDVKNGTFSEVYVRGIGLVASKKSSTFSYYQFNGHGDVVRHGTKTYDYDAFGVEREPSSSDANPFRYCGEYFDVETGTVYLRARYYSPKTGRFTTEDKYRGYVKDPLSLNYYTYSVNNPIKYFDPSGYVIQLSGTDDEKEEILEDLNELTDDWLWINEDGEVISFKEALKRINELLSRYGCSPINHTFTNNFPAGTKLIADLIASTFKVTIEYSLTITKPDGTT